MTGELATGEFPHKTGLLPCGPVNAWKESNNNCEDVRMRSSCLLRHTSCERSSQSTCSTPVIFESPETLQHLLLRLAGCSSLARAKLHAALTHRQAVLNLGPLPMSSVRCTKAQSKRPASSAYPPVCNAGVWCFRFCADKWFVVRGNGKKPFCSGEALSPLVSRRRADDLVMPSKPAEQSQVRVTRLAIRFRLNPQYQPLYW